jgi:hypothetical protein
VSERFVPARDNEACRFCRFYRRYWSEAPDGDCRRHPPTVAKDGDGVWATVRGSNWCGEFQRDENGGERVEP